MRRGGKKGSVVCDCAIPGKSGGLFYTGRESGDRAIRLRMKDEGWQGKDQREIADETSTRGR